MIQLPEDRRPAITPQLALRVAILGGIALALFAIVFFRLWYLQVLSGEDYLAQARDNRVRDIRIPAPRGDIVDRNGTTLVDNRIATVVQIEVDKLPAVERELAAEYQQRVARARPRNRRKVKIPPLPRSERELRVRYARLGRVLRMSPRTIHRAVVRQVGLTPYSDVTIKTDVPRTVYQYLGENQQRFPGVSVQRLFLRSYPFEKLAAQLFGAVGEISPDELKEERYRGVKQGTIVGQGGIEETYDRYLRGRDGARKVQVDSFGRPKGQVAGQREPVKGKQLRLSLDLDLQRAGQEAMAVATGLANRNGNPAKAGGFVALDPRNGEVLALGSYPSFDPNVFSRPLSQRRYEALFGEQAGSPLFNRAVQGLYPTGSTFKVVTATAALQSGLITPETTIYDPGFFKLGPSTFKNAGGVSNGSLALRRALQVSSDVFFYTLGARLDGLEEQVLQRWARRLGLGRRTGIDLPGEFEGQIPDPAWRRRVARREFACRKRRKVPACGISDGRPWSTGDNVNLAVGQGDLQATPLQMAVAYATIANGGKVVRPHLGLQVEDSAGRVLQKIEPGAARHVQLSPAGRQAILDGLRLAAGAPGGTSYDVFKGFPRPVYGKTGTAERHPHADQSWYVAFAPDRRRPIVIAVTVEQGGFGAEAAAPAARLMLSQWFGVKKKVVKGTSRTN